MEIKGKKFLVCDCEGTMPLDAEALAKACGGEAPKVYTQLCRSQIGEVQRAVLGETPVVVACTQEAPLFAEVKEDSNPNASLSFTNIRERAGWSDQAESASAKIAALLAEAALDIPPTPGVSMESQGVTLVYGRDETAIEAAKRLASRLDVTILLTDPDAVLPPKVVDVPVFKGTIAKASGHLGAFDLSVDGYAAMTPSSRGALAFGAPQDGATSTCELILDLTGGPPLFPAPDTRDGYFNPDPGNPAAVEKALFDIADMVGDFEKPIYVNYNPDICVHSRSERVGCTRCLDVCPTSAIAPDGDHVKIDPHVCAGCGSCASVCPTGAATYALPAGDAIFQRLRTLLGTYREAGGTAPVVLVHDTRHGDDMIHAIGRHGRGLPARVLPFALNEVTQVGLEFFAAALAYGAAQVRVLVGPSNRDHLPALAGQVELAESALSGLGYGAGRVALIDAEDPDAVEGELYGLEPVEPPAPASFLPMGGTRTVTMLALRHLHEHAPEPVDILPLPAGSPFGAVAVDTEGCTLCLACIGACPTGALIDNPDRPTVRFQEDACVQCGLCRNTCPESVITLSPRFNFTGEARAQLVLNEEEPFACVRCGKPFGTRASIERTVEKLAEHSMYAGDPQALDRIKMCSDCRVIVQFEAPQPMATRPRPLTRTTDDYLHEREQAKAREMHERSQKEAAGAPGDETANKKNGGGA
ncbi:MAG: 4Fe-4S dicluster domain-containing protein [Proteobacteria bacterium]|nr:4Fe-4S dicluster domain-containing protein [Pseudomonadota bacterium]